MGVFLKGQKLAQPGWPDWPFLPIRPLLKAHN
jgi:hypothetical protein